MQLRRARHLITAIIPFGVALAASLATAIFSFRGADAPLQVLKPIKTWIACPDLPPQPRPIGDDKLYRAQDEGRCGKLAQKRLDYLEARLKIRALGCGVLPNLGAMGYRLFAEAAACADALPPRPETTVLVRRINAIAGSVADPGPLPCGALGAMHTLFTNQPQALAAFATSIGARLSTVGHECVDERGGLTRAKPGFVAWLETPGRLAALMSVTAGSSPAPVAVTAPRRGNKLTVDIGVNGKWSARALIDTGSKGFALMTMPAAQAMGLTGVATGDDAVGCMGPPCKVQPLRLGWIDALVLGHYTLRNVPLEIIDSKPNDQIVIGAAVLARVGGLTIAGIDPYTMAVAFGPPLPACRRKLPTELAYRGACS